MQDSKSKLNQSREDNCLSSSERPQFTRVLCGYGYIIFLRKATIYKSILWLWLDGIEWILGI